MIINKKRFNEIAVLYGSKYGATEKASKLISEKLIANHEKNNIGSIDVEIIDLKEKDNIGIDYDFLIIDSSVYIGRIRKEVKNFIKKNKDILIENPQALFIRGSNEIEGIKQINKAFPSEIVNKSKAIAYLSGEFNLDKMGFFDRKIAQSIIKGADKEFKINIYTIDEFVKEINI